MNAERLRKPPVFFSSSEEREAWTISRFDPDAFDRGPSLDAIGSETFDLTILTGAGVLLLVLLVSLFQLKPYHGAALVENSYIPFLASATAVAEREAGNFQRAIEVVKSFGQTKTIKERAKYVIDSQRVLPLMENYYRGESLVRLRLSNLEVNRMIVSEDVVHYLIGGIHADSFEPVWLTVTVPKGLLDRVEAYRIDWEALVAHGSMSWEEFKEKRPAAGQTLRVYAELGNYFRGGFTDPREWICLALKDQSRELQVYGYVDRRSALGTDLSNHLWKRPNVPLTIQVSWPDGQASRHDQVVINRLIQRGWHASFTNK